MIDANVSIISWHHTITGVDGSGNGTMTASDVDRASAHQDATNPFGPAAGKASDSAA